MNQNDQNVSKPEPLQLTVTPEIMTAGKVLLLSVDRYNKVNSNKHFSHFASAMKAERLADEALDNFRAAVLQDNPQMDYAKLPVDWQFDKRHRELRSAYTDTLNELLMKMAVDEGFSNPQQFAVFSKTKYQFQL